jgi:hypothetical protein
MILRLRMVSVKEPQSIGCELLVLLKYVQFSNIPKYDVCILDLYNLKH